MHMTKAGWHFRNFFVLELCCQFSRGMCGKSRLKMLNGNGGRRSEGRSRSVRLCRLTRKHLPPLPRVVANGATSPLTAVPPTGRRCGAPDPARETPGGVHARQTLSRAYPQRHNDHAGQRCFGSSPVCNPPKLAARYSRVRSCHGCLYRRSVR